MRDEREQKILRLFRELTGWVSERDLAARDSTLVCDLYWALPRLEKAGFIKRNPDGSTTYCITDLGLGTLH